MNLMNRLHGIKWSFELSNRKRTHWTANTKCSRCNTSKHFERLARKQQRSIPIHTIKRQQIRLHGIKWSFELSSRKRTYWLRMNNVQAVIRTNISNFLLQNKKDQSQSTPPKDKQIACQRYCGVLLFVFKCPHTQKSSAPLAFRNKLHASFTKGS